jgi:uncharacterized protein (TIGR00297 family)
MLFLTLDKRGLALAILMGAAFLLLGIGFGPFFVLTMLIFLVLSAVVTHIGHDYKKKLFGKESERRGVWNVLANGIAPLLAAAAFFFAATNGLGRLEVLCVIGFVASVAAIAADKFESEIGIFEDDPRMIFTFKKSKKGTSGAMTIPGLLSGVLGAMLIALTLILVMHQLQALYAASTPLTTSALLSVVIGGFVGSVVDSMLGYFEEKGVGNKYTTNLVCGICGGLAGMLLFLLIV